MQPKHQCSLPVARTMHILVGKKQFITDFSIFFQVIMFCVKEPDPFCGGETVLLKNRDLTTLLNPELIRKLEEKKIRYQAFLPNKDEKSELQKSWQDRFWVDDPQVCMAKLNLLNWEMSKSNSNINNIDAAIYIRSNHNQILLFYIHTLRLNYCKCF